MLNIPTPIPLVPGQLQVWIADLQAWDSYWPVFRTLLSSSETNRLERFKVQAKQDEFLVSRGLLRLVLGAYLGKDPQQLAIEVDPFGKPYLRGSELGFNISHSSKVLLCACGLSLHIGVDVQEIYAIRGQDRIVERYFSPAEKEYLNQMGSPSRDSFFELWSAKEALLKAVGSGFQTDPAQISLVPDHRIPGRYSSSIPGAQAQLWSVIKLEIGKEFKAAVAADGEIETTILIPLECESAVG